jgi:hypothetical protein
MYLTSRITLGRSLSRIKVLASVRSLYTLAFALLLGSAALIAFPMGGTRAASCSAACNQGETINIAGAQSCSCTDNQGCNWTINGKSYSSSCGTIPISGFATIDPNVAE